MKATFEQLLHGEVSQVSILNQKVDYVVDYTVPKAESATARARRRWGMMREGEADERERV